MRLAKKTVRVFQKKILSHYRDFGRRLPFRTTTDPYKITVSEIMLQQTQVDRVIPFYQRWIKKFPNWKALAGASNKALLLAWSGLGYNRRALNLGRLAKTITQQYRGKLPTREEQLLPLPGIGPYTANAILIFAFNKPRVTIDTNIRRVLIHELKLRPSLSSSELKKVALQVLPNNNSRDWHNALMDYGALVLPRTPHIRPLTRQSKFVGSIRQIRGSIIRQLTKQRSVSVISVAEGLHRPIAHVLQAARGLQKDGLVRLSRGVIRVLENP